MKRTAKVTIGIDVTATRVSMVMLRPTPAGGAVSDAVSVAVPPGVIVDGRIADPKALARVLKGVKRLRMRNGSISLSLPMAGTLTRILPLTEQDPQRISQFVREELKQYAVLSGRETVSDFRVLAPARQDARGAVLVAAADQENVASLATAAQLAGLQIDVIEPAAVACVRLFHASRTSTGTDLGTMIVLLKEATLTLCVFRRGLLDFIRTEVLESGKDEGQAIGPRIAEEITAVMRFYSLRHDAVKQWKILLADDEGSSVLPQIQNALGTSAAVESIRPATSGSLPAEMGIDLRGHKDVSLTALGLALKAGEDASLVNLLPPGVSAARSNRRNVFILANAAAVLLLAVIIGTGILSYAGKRIGQRIVEMKQQSLKRGDLALPFAVVAKAHLNEQMGRLTGEIKCLKALGGSHPAVDWVQLLKDVQSACPVRRVQLIGVTSSGGEVVIIRGNAVSPEAVQAFVDALNTSGQIRHAAQKEWSRKSHGIIEFEVQCTLSPEKAS
jgi:hypothetical protein